MEAGSRRKRRRRRSGRCKASSETKSASPAKTGEGGRECMKIRGEEEFKCDREKAD